MKLVTWNLNSIKARYSRLELYLEKYRPDIVCLQELKCEESMFPKEAIEKLGYHAYVLGQKTYNGVAILSLKPGKIRFKNIPGYNDIHSRLIGVEIGPFTWFSIYAPNGQAPGTEKYEYKLKWYKALIKFLKAHSKELDRWVLAGDYNIAPEDKDVHDPIAWEGQIHCTVPEREALRTLLKLGFKDTFRKYHAEPGHYSWWDYRQLAFPKNKGLRIDFALAGEKAYEACTAAAIDREQRKGSLPSDHAPVLTEFA